jgi:hypothetical protein
MSFASVDNSGSSLWEMIGVDRQGPWSKVFCSFVFGAPLSPASSLIKRAKMSKDPFGFGPMMCDDV